MPQLHLLIYRPPAFFPARSGHWALFLPYEEGGSVGYGLGVKKASFRTTQTQFEIFEASLEIGRDDLQRHIKLQIYVNGINDLNVICHGVTQGRPFNLVTRNCQHWVCEVIEVVITRFNIPDGPAELARIKAMGINT
jgi:hypothetical protein